MAEEVVIRRWRDRWGNEWVVERDAQLADAQPEDPIVWRKKALEGNGRANFAAGFLLGGAIAIGLAMFMQAL